MSVVPYKPRALYKKMDRVMKAGWVSFVQSSPGIGKSSIGALLAEKNNLKLIDHRLSTSAPEDLTGLPYFTAEGKARFFPFADLFPLEDTALPEGYSGWLLFLDEFNSASKSVQAAAYKLILDRMVGQHKLHEKVHIICAGNLVTDRALTNSLSTAMQSRLIHLELQVDYDEWLEDVAYKHNYDSRIIGFLAYKPNYLMDFRPDHNDKTFCCPRTWQMMNDLIKGQKIESDDLALFGGTITSGVAAEFMSYCEVASKLVTIDDVVKDPNNCRLPENNQMGFATISHLMEMTDKDNFEKVVDYINRLDMSLRIIYLRGVIIRKTELRTQPAYARAGIALSRYLNEK